MQHGCDRCEERALTSQPQRALRPAGDEAGLAPYAQSLPLALLRAREAVMARLRPHLREHGVTEQQWRVLRTLSALDEIEVTLLADQVFLHPPSLSRILRDLTERGLVSRRPSKTDLRRNLVAITAVGLRLIEETAPQAALASAEIEALFGATRTNRLKALLDALETVLAEV